MKLKFLTMVTLLLFARGCDFYSTSLWFFEPGGMEGEMNPLTRLFGVGWNGLIISNLIIISLIIGAYFYYVFRYRRKQHITGVNNFPDFVSELYYEQKGKAYQVFYKAPIDKKMLIAHIGYVMIRVTILGSFLATFHNLCQYYQAGFYDTFRNIVGRPLYVIYGLIVLSMFFFLYSVLKKEYSANMKSS